MGKKYLKTARLGRVTVENNFMHLYLQDNTLKKSLQSFQTIYCISLRKSGIYKQTEKQTFSLNSLKLKIPNLTSGVGCWKTSPKIILLARIQISNHMLL